MPVWVLRAIGLIVAVVAVVAVGHVAGAFFERRAENERARYAIRLLTRILIGVGGLAVMWFIAGVALFERP